MQAKCSANNVSEALILRASFFGIFTKINILFVKYLIFVGKGDITLNNHDRALYLLTNYQRIAASYLRIDKGHPDYNRMQNYIQKMKKYFEILHTKPCPNTNFLSSEIPERKKMKELYLDTLNYSYFLTEQLSSKKIIAVLNEKYKVDLTPVKLSKIKARAVSWFETVL